MSTEATDAGRGGRRAWAVAVVALWLVATALVIFVNAFSNSRAAHDQDNYHLLTVQKFARELPRVELGDYRSATTPGYHLVLAEVARVASADLRVLRVTGAVFTAGLLLTLSLLAVKLGRAPGAGAVIAPLACSLYVFSAGAWLLPDNAGWWGVLGVVSIALFCVPSAASMFAVSGVLLALVLCRQNHLWTAGVVWAWGFLGGPGEIPDARTRMRRVGMAMLATVPAFAAVGAFWNLWHGPVPPLFQGGVFDPVVAKLSPKNTGGNAATPAFLLMLFGAYGVFFLGYLGEGLRRVRAGETVAVAGVALGMIAGLVLALVTETTYSVDAGRYTGFWALVARLPVIGGRSLFLAGGAAVGGAVIGLCLASLDRRRALLVLAAVVAFGAAQSTAFAAWQRYMEPMVLIVMALVAISVPRAGATGSTGPLGTLARWAWAGPAILGAGLAAVTLASLRSGSGGIA